MEDDLKNPEIYNKKSEKEILPNFMDKKPPVLDEEEKLKLRPFFEDSFQRHCNNYGISCQFAHNIVFLRTPRSWWRVEHENCYVSSFEHENTRKTRSIAGKNGHLKYGEDFHMQALTTRDIYKIVPYISDTIIATTDLLDIMPLLV